MYLKELQLVNFRNYPEANLKFNESIVVITGDNGAGKTNLLDAVHYLSFCKSFLNPIDSQNIRLNESFFVIQGKYSNEGRVDQIYCGIKRGQKKVFKRNNKDYERLSEHIGRIPLVVISPTDISLVSEGSEERRKFIDSVISQHDKPYLDNLIKYTRLIQQRNASLKSGYAPDDLLDVFDEQLSDLAQPIFDARSNFLNKLSELVQDYYRLLCDAKETVSLSYESNLLTTGLSDLLVQSREKDRIMQYTTKGVHKDDIGMQINDFPLKKYASQGQLKSFLIALKLAQFDILSEIKESKPILLLDDIFEKLDQSRITSLMTLVSQNHFGQIFITDSHPERIALILREIKANFDHYSVNQAKLEVL